MLNINKQNVALKLIRMLLKASALLPICYINGLMSVSIVSQFLNKQHY